MVGYRFNVNSTQQLSDALFTKLSLPTAGMRKNQSGYYSTAADVLEGLRGQHPAIDLILEQRQLDEAEGHLRGRAAAAGQPSAPAACTPRSTRRAAVTGRISSSNPNLQNIPIRTEVGREVRRAFVAEPGWQLVAADYSQVELRVLAHVSQDAGLLGAFERDEDIHAATAAAVLGVPIAEVTKDQRRIAKSVNFGLSYGQGAYGLAQQTGMSQAGCGPLHPDLLRAVPRRAALHRADQAPGRRTGLRADAARAAALLPRPGQDARRRSAARAEREAINMPIQGTAADIIKIAMIRLHERLQRARHARRAWCCRCTTSWCWRRPTMRWTAAIPLLRDVMGGAFDLAVPLKVDVEVGTNWLEMSDERGRRQEAASRHAQVGTMQVVTIVAQPLPPDLQSGGPGYRRAADLKSAASE